jgi:hypothetical protein
LLSRRKAGEFRVDGFLYRIYYCGKVLKASFDGTNTTDKENPDYRIGGYSSYARAISRQ